MWELEMWRYRHLLTMLLSYLAEDTQEKSQALELTTFTTRKGLRKHTAVSF